MPKADKLTNYTCRYGLHHPRNIMYVRAKSVEHARNKLRANLENLYSKAKPEYKPIFSPNLSDTADISPYIRN